MPYKSKAQRGYMNAAADRGDIPRSVVDEFNRESKGQRNLPQRVKPKKRRAADLARSDSRKMSNLTSYTY